MTKILDIRENNDGTVDIDIEQKGKYYTLTNCYPASVTSTERTEPVAEKWEIFWTDNTLKS